MSLSSAEKNQAALDCINLHDEVFLHPNEYGYYKEDTLYVSDQGALYIEVKAGKSIKRAGLAGNQRMALGSIPSHVHTPDTLIKLCAMRMAVLSGHHNILDKKLMFAKYLVEKGHLNEDISTDAS